VAMMRVLISQYAHNFNVGDTRFCISDNILDANNGT